MNTRNLNSLHEEINTTHPLRLVKKQKEAFLHTVEKKLKGWEYEVENSKKRYWGVQNRQLITKCDDPQIVFMAHYDTPTMMPSAYQWIYRFFGHTRQNIAIPFSIVLTIALIQVHDWLAITQAWYWTLIYIVAMLLLFLLPVFIPNPHNAEDNTSGVVGLLALAEWVKDKAFREKIQFAFLDNEEWGLIGSSALKKVWKKKKHLRHDTMLINLDCISRGSTPLLIYHKEIHLAESIAPFLEENFPKIKMINMKGIPLSDNFTFRERGAIDISLGDPAIIPGGFLISDVHSPRDKDFNAENAYGVMNALIAYTESNFSEGLK